MKHEKSARLARILINNYRELVQHRSPNDLRATTEGRFRFISRLLIWYPVYGTLTGMVLFVWGEGHRTEFVGSGTNIPLVTLGTLLIVGLYLVYTHRRGLWDWKSFREASVTFPAVMVIFWVFIWTFVGLWM